MSGPFVKLVFLFSRFHGNITWFLLNFYNAILDYWFTCLRFTDLRSCLGVGMCWLCFDRAQMRVGVREGRYRLRLHCRLCRGPEFRLQRCLLPLNSRRVGAGWDICCCVGSWAEVSIGTGRNISVGTWGNGSIWAGRVMEMKAHRRTCDWGGGRAWYRATGYGHCWHYPLLVLKKKNHMMLL